jgi:hypothetical protein
MRLQMFADRLAGDDRVRAISASGVSTKARSVAHGVGEVQFQHGLPVRPFAS